MEIKLLVDSGNSQVKWVVLFRAHPGANLLATSARVDVKTVLRKQGFFKKLILKSIKSFKKHSTRDFKFNEAPWTEEDFDAENAYKTLLRQNT